MNKLIVFFSIIIQLLVHPCFSQSSSIILEGFELKLGMDKNYVNNLIKPNYELKKIPSNNNEFLIVTKNGPPYRVIGTVQFNQNKLTYIEKNWGQFEGENMVKFGNSLYNLISKLNEKGNTFAIVKSYKGAREPTIISNKIVLSFGDHQIILVVSESNIYGYNISIFESLSK